MKSKEEIINDSIKLETPPADYNLLEIHCFLALKQVTVMFYNKQISKENATKTKQLILAGYESKCKEYEFQANMFQEYIDNIKKTENGRIKLRKMLNGKEEYNNLITEERWAELVNTCLQIIKTIFKEETF